MWGTILAYFYLPCATSFRFFKSVQIGRAGRADSRALKGRAARPSSRGRGRAKARIRALRDIFILHAKSVYRNGVAFFGVAKKFGEIC